MTKASSFILRLYFAVVAVVTLFTLMFGTVALLDIGLKTYIFTAADAPSWIENCSDPVKYREPAIEGNDPITEEESLAACESRNAAEQSRYEQSKASDAVNNLAMIIVSLPLFLFHFRIVYRDWAEEKNTKKEKK